MIMIGSIHKTGVMFASPSGGLSRNHQKGSQVVQFSKAVLDNQTFSLAWQFRLLQFPSPEQHVAFDSYDVAAYDQLKLLNR